MPRTDPVTLEYSGNEFFTIAPSATRTLDIDLGDAEGVRFLIEAHYTLTGGTTGISLRQFYGFGVVDPLAEGSPAHKIDGTVWATFGDTYDDIEMEPSVINFTGPGTTVSRTVHFLTDPLTTLPRWIRFVFTNNDIAHPVDIRIAMEV